MPDCKFDEFLEMCENVPRASSEGMHMYWAKRRDYCKAFEFVADGYRDWMIRSNFGKTNLDSKGCRVRYINLLEGEWQVI